MNKQYEKNISIHLNTPYEDENIIVHFVGDITFTHYSEIGYHNNPGYEICFIPNGKGFFKINEKIYPVSQKQVFITKAEQSHDGWPSRENPYRILYLCFHIKDNPKVSPAWNKIHNKLELIEFPLTNGRLEMEDIHRRLLGEILQKDAFSADMTGNLVQQFILMTLRDFEKNIEKNSNNYLEGMEKLLSSRVINFVDKHIKEDITLDIVSSALNYSIPYLCRKFKEQTGFSIMEYYNFARLEKAKKLLLETQSNVSQISDMLKFNSIHHFSNAFKELYGSSPMNYKKIPLSNFMNYKLKDSCQLHVKKR